MQSHRSQEATLVPGRSAIRFKTTAEPQVWIMLLGIAIILCCQLLGEAISHGLSVPIPGPVVGMVFLIAVLWLRDNGFVASRSREFYAIENTGRSILSHLSILFVPASVGIIQKFGILSKYGLALGISIVVSTVLALLASAYTFILVARLAGTEDDR